MNLDLVNEPSIYRQQNRPENKLEFEKEPSISP